ncbi:MAG: HAMP domain-containing sensor histidine kinase [Planctomycetota bacterium]
MARKPNQTPWAAGSIWAWLALGSGAALLALLLWDLQRTLELRGRQVAIARWQALRSEVREAQREFLLPETVAGQPEAQQFTWAENGYAIPEGVGWVEPQVVTAWPAVVAVWIADAHPLAPAEARVVWQRCLDSGGLDEWQRSELLLAAAWQAQRAGEDGLAREWLQQIGNRCTGVQAASRLLLQAKLDGALPSDAMQVAAQMEPEAAQAMEGRLREFGLPAKGLAERARQAAETRRRLAAVFAMEAPEESSWRVLPGGEVAAFDAEAQRGSWWTRADLERWVEQNTEGGRLVAWGEAAPASPEMGIAGEAIPFLPGAAEVVLAPADGPAAGSRWGSAANQTLFLILGLAGLCGGFVWLALRAARREALAARTRQEFLTMVTHELKTPLAGIRLVSELLADDHVQDPAKRRRYLGSLTAEATRLSMLIENVLDLRRLERGERAQDAGRENLSDILRDTVELFGPLLERDGRTVQAGEIDDELHAWVDRDDLRQALLNVLDNARKYGGQGTIHLKLVPRDRHAVLSVCDEGPGVPADQREAIFERFVRGREHQHGSIPGVGIGLSLARSILRRHGGDLVCAPAPPGAGACFELILPLELQTQTDHAD